MVCGLWFFVCIPFPFPPPPPPDHPATSSLRLHFPVRRNRVQVCSMVLNSTHISRRVIVFRSYLPLTLTRAWSRGDVCGVHVLCDGCSARVFDSVRVFDSGLGRLCACRLTPSQAGVMGSLQWQPSSRALLCGLCMFLHTTSVCVCMCMFVRACVCVCVCM